MATKAEFLEQHSLFKELTEEEIEALALITDEVRYENGAMVAYQGDVADSLYIVKSGRLYAEARKNDIENDSYVVKYQKLPGGRLFWRRLALCAQCASGQRQSRFAPGQSGHPADHQRHQLRPFSQPIP
jgi:CRP-like cAMP-binding protein